MNDFFKVLEENYQAQIAGFYNHDKTDVEKKIRQAVINEYKDLMSIYKAKFTVKVETEQASPDGWVAEFHKWLNGEILSINSQRELHGKSERIRSRQAALIQVMTRLEHLSKSFPLPASPDAKPLIEALEKIVKGIQPYTPQQVREWKKIATEALKNYKP